MDFKVENRAKLNKKTVIINSASSALSILINISVLVWLQQYLLLRITPEEYSILPLIMSLMAFTPLLTIILTGGIARHITMAYIQNKDREVSQICTTMFPILCITSLIIVAIGGTVALNIQAILNLPSHYIEDAKLMLSLQVFILALSLPLSVFNSAFVVKQKLLLQDVINLSCQILRLILLLSLFTIISVEVKWVVISTVSAELVNLVVSSFVGIKLMPSLKIKTGKFRFELARSIINYGIWNFIGQVSATIKQAFDPLILNRFSDAINVATFHVASIAPRQLILLLNPLIRPFIPVLNSIVAENNNSKLKNTYLRTCRYHSWVLLCIAVPAIIFSDKVMFLYLGGKYPETGPIMAILVLVTALNGLNALGFAVAAARGTLRGITIRILLIDFVNIILTVIFVVNFKAGAIGAATATAISFVVLEISIKWPYCRKIAYTSTKEWANEVVTPTLLLTIPSIIFCLIIKESNIINSIFELAAISIISLIIYLLFILRFGLRIQDKNDLELLSKKYPKLKTVTDRLI